MCFYLNVDRRRMKLVSQQTQISANSQESTKISWFIPTEYLKTSHYFNRALIKSRTSWMIVKLTLLKCVSCGFLLYLFSVEFTYYLNSKMLQAVAWKYFNFQDIVMSNIFSIFLNRNNFILCIWFQLIECIHHSFQAYVKCPR